MRIWLDNLRPPPSIDWIWVDNTATSINLLSKLNITEISLGGYLGDVRIYGEGYDVIFWITIYLLFNP